MQKQPKKDGRAERPSEIYSKIISQNEKLTGEALAGWLLAEKEALEHIEAMIGTTVARMRGLKCRVDFLCIERDEIRGLINELEKKHASNSKKQR